MSDFEIFSIPSSKIDQLPESVHPNLFASAGWMSVLLDQYNFDLFCIRELQSRDFLLAAQITHFGFTKINVLPFCDYVIPSINNADGLRDLIAHLTQTHPRIPVELKIILPKGINPDNLAPSLQHTAFRHVVNTSPGVQKIEKRMDNSFMRGVRKAESHDLDISMRRDDEALNIFYDIYCKQRISKFEKLPQPYSFFQKIEEHFFRNNKGFILQAEKDTQVIASMIILQHHDTLYYKFGCSRSDSLNYRPNNMLFYKLFSYASKNNVAQVDLGLSGTTDSYKGLRRFKEYMGGMPENIYSLRVDPPDYDHSAENELNTFTQALTQTIVGQQPDPQTVDNYSKTLYPYFV